ncbi:MAG: RDD family protein [Verrucomicrobiaceae bacterium]|nr:RDD family protein [Verrucomicrobiaceae bacterium]
MDYHLARNGQQLGVFAEEEIQPGIATGRFLPDDLCWSEGMADWKPLSTKFSAPATPSPPPFSAAAAAPFNPYAAPQSNIISAAMLPRLKLASRGARLGAAIIDTLIILLVITVPVVIGVVLMGQAEKAGGNDVPVAAVACFAVAGLATLGLLVWNAVWLTKYGQTIAKRMLKIRVVTFPDGQNAGFVKAFLLRAVVNAIINQFVPLYGIVDACFIFREDQRCLHDLIADTTVVECEPGA